MITSAGVLVAMHGKLKDYRLVIVGSVLWAMLATTHWLWFRMPLSAAALFCGLEGTLLLASMLAPPPGNLRVRPPAGCVLRRRVAWYFVEGAGLRHPVSYNPIFFYLGLGLLAVSMFLGAVTARGDDGRDALGVSWKATPVEALNGKNDDSLHRALARPIENDQLMLDEQ